MLALLATTVGACAAGSIDLPEPPMTEETEAVIAVYKSPTGTVDVAHIDMQLDEAEARLAELHLSWLPDLVSDALIGLEERLSDAELPIDPDASAKENEPRISAAVVLHRTCKGWSDPPGLPDAAANGTIELTAVVGASQLRRDIWGVATNCRTLIPTSGGGANQMAFIDGTLILQLQGALPRQPGDLEVLFLLNGRLETSGNDVVVANEVKTAERDFRIKDGQIEFRLPVSDGDIIVKVGLTSLTLRGSNGTFECELGSHKCH
jgi:hypothetical protein